MTVQWTGHIPQAMQRHGASLKPCGDAAIRNKANENIQPDSPPRVIAEPGRSADAQAA